MTPIVERRLRAALAVRAGQITAADLQPAAPPSLLASEQAARARRGRRSGGHRLTLSQRLGLGGRSQRLGLGGRWMPLLAGVGVAAVAVVFAVLVMWHPREAGPPGRAPYLPGNAPASSPAPTESGPATEPPTRSPDRSRPASADDPTTTPDTTASPSAARPRATRTGNAPVPTASTPGGSSPRPTRSDPPPVRSTVTTG